MISSCLIRIILCEYSMLVYENEWFIFNVKQYNEFIYFYCRNKISNCEWSNMIYDTENILDNSQIIYPNKNDNNITIQIIKQTDILNIKLVRLQILNNNNVFMSV